MQRAISSSLGGPSPSGIASKIQSSPEGVTGTYHIYNRVRLLFDLCSSQANYMIPPGSRNSMLTGKGANKTAEGEDLGVPDLPNDLTDTTDSATDSATTSTPASNLWFNTIGLQPTFSTWSSVTYLHMYILLVRLRALDIPHDIFTQYQHYLIDSFSIAAEDKMVTYHNMAARSVRQKYLKNLFLQWRGLVVAYDEGMLGGDTALGGAVWRNVFKGREDVDWEAVAVVVRYMRSGIAGLGRVTDGELLGAILGGESGFDIFKKTKAELTRKALKES